ncbi:hypothetical protein [Algoriphagus aquimarinus]|uniref:Uncharacterized protein n=1 Tax=Algoriphagus aquimarinus TaxID=237018 RepID=A0A1I1A481_9BACT|nr:hypothetical protein [Algoriphagus aquimarinus]SFB32834.1 hypothetical protein SAMN04489723_107173 [Algoriphagus aquimarinus]
MPPKSDELDGGIFYLTAESDEGDAKDTKQSLDYYSKSKPQIQ